MIKLLIDVELMIMGTSLAAVKGQTSKKIYDAVQQTSEDTSSADVEEHYQ